MLTRNHLHTEKQSLYTNESLFISKAWAFFFFSANRIRLSFDTAAGDTLNEIFLQREEHEDRNDGGNG